MTILKTRITKIGSSSGIRIPKRILDQANIGKEAEVAVEENRLVIRPARHPREGWAAEFRKMVEHGDDRLLDTPPPTRFDGGEWEWQ